MAEKLFTKRNIVNLISNTRIVGKTAEVLSGTNNTSSSSFRYDAPGTGLKSTQQISVDYGQFQNHTFFGSAEAKVNNAFDLMINEFPFDGTRKELEAFEDKLTGFEKHVLNEFPKSKNYLFFDTTLSSSITINDYKGSQNPTLSRDTSGASGLDPVEKSMTFEFKIFVPEKVNEDQIILQKLSGSNGITLSLSHSISTADCSMVMLARSGSADLGAKMTLNKGRFQHVVATLNRENKTGGHILELYSGSALMSTSSYAHLGPIDFQNSSLQIGTGRNHTPASSGLLTDHATNSHKITANQILSGALDELRIFHSIRKPSLISAYENRPIFPNKDLKLYFKFNEPSGSFAGNNLVLDYSGKSLHSTVTNYNASLRNNTPRGISNPMLLENESDCPVLFPANSGLTSLNSSLLSLANDYDANNPNLITRLIPRHYFEDAAFFEGFENEEADTGNSYEARNNFPGGGKLPSSTVVASLLYVYAKHFDELKMHIDHFSKMLEVDYTSDNTVSDQFLRFIGQYYGFDLPSQFTNTSVNQFIRGENVLANDEIVDNSLKSVQNEIWRRILANLSEIMRSKGTIHSIESLMRTVGIRPNKLFRIKEYGGPTKKTLQSSRIVRDDVSSMVDMSGTMAGTAGSVNFAGIPTNRPFFMSSYLTASRVEIGAPAPKGSFVLKDTFKPHGVSNSQFDGLLTSGSWSVEGIYKFGKLSTGSYYPLTQSMLRLHTSGTAVASDPGSGPTGHHVLANLLVLSASNLADKPSIVLYASPAGSGSTDYTGLNFFTGSTDIKELRMELTGVNLFDGDKWNVSFGRHRRDMINANSSSYFLRAAKNVNGEIISFYSTSSFYNPCKMDRNAVNLFELTSTRENSNGTFIAIGSQSLDTRLARSLSSTSSSIESRETNFIGKFGHIRFWSKYLNEKEFREHAKNYKSLGVVNPEKNFNFVKSLTGSFERLRLDVSSDQPVTKSNSSGDITLIDFAQNDFALNGTGFEPSKRVIKPERFYYSMLSPNIDEISSDNKVRIRSFQDAQTAKDFNVAQSPVYELERSETPIDDPRFTVDVSVVQALNEDIINIFATLDKLDDSLGRPETLFSDDYKQLRNLRDVYFNRLTDKINFRSFFELFKWFDSSIGFMIETLLPSKTTYLGTNFVIESHVLERPKFKYLFHDHYLDEDLRDIKPLSDFDAEAGG